MSMFDCNFSLETFISNLVSLTHSSLQILDKTQSFMEICTILIFQIYCCNQLQQFGRQIPHAWFIMLKFSLIATFLLTKGEYRMKNL